MLIEASRDLVLPQNFSLKSHHWSDLRSEIWTTWRKADESGSVRLRMKNIQTKQLITGNKLICTLNIGFFPFSRMTLNSINELFCFVFSFYRVTQEGQSVVDRKIMSSVTLLRKKKKKVSQNILKPYEVWKYETLLHTYCRLRLTSVHPGNDLWPELRSPSPPVTMIWLNTRRCFAFNLILALFAFKKKKMFFLSYDFQWRSSTHTNLWTGIKLKPGAFPLLVHSFQTQKPKVQTHKLAEVVFCLTARFGKSEAS